MSALGMLASLIDRLTPPPRSRQVKTEFRDFLHQLAELDVRSYLEVGAYRGGTFYRVMRSLPHGALGATVDDDSRNTLRGCPSPLAKVGERLRGIGYRIETVIGNSHQPATIEAARRLGPFDAVLIDADHRYEGVKRDWENYGPMAPAASSPSTISLWSM